MKKMRRIQSWLWLFAALILIEPGCRSQESRSSSVRVVRPMAVAGSFYPSDSAELHALLESLFSHAKPAIGNKNTIAIIVPHAGYEFSGAIAAAGYNQISPYQHYDNIFIIGSSHHVSFMGASIDNAGDYRTPFGTVKVNTDLAKKLIRENAFFSYNAEADGKEHSIEVQLPFLQYYLKNSFNLVPVVMGTQSAESCRKVAMALKPYLGGNNLFVISTDFSHYPAYEDARITDKNTCDAIATNQPESLLRILKTNDDLNIPNLATSLCGWTSVLTLLNMTAGDPGVTFKPVQYLNSGDSKYQNKSQVVGYWAIAVEKSLALPASPGFELSKKDKKELLTIARNTLDQYIRFNKTPEIKTSGFSGQINTPCGVFVTLKENGELRGCIGRFTAEEPLYQVVQQMTIASSTEDGRFQPVDPKEIGRITIELSVLSPMKRINSIDEIVMGKHGIYIKKGYRSGTFLPQVATETGWSKEDFLGHCSRDKAGLSWNGWKDAEIYIYEAVVFSEEEINGRKD
jgi:AmmeMemoRadiSam system protein B/AmmeMemoRadiSam system protein A